MPWELSGNEGIDPSANFIGTKDKRPLIIKTCNVERLRITETGMIDVHGADLVLPDSANYSLRVLGEVTIEDIPPKTVPRFIPAVPGRLQVSGSAPRLSLTHRDAQSPDGKTWSFENTNDNRLLITGPDKTARLAVTGDASITGNVGIGTADPKAMLHVNGEFQVDGNLLVTQSGTLLFKDKNGTDAIRIDTGTASVGAGGPVREGTLLLNDKKYQLTVRLDAAEALLAAGGPVREGVLLLNDKQYQASIRLDAADASLSAGGPVREGFLCLNDKQYIPNLRLDAADASLAAGGPSREGYLQLNDKAYNPRIRLDAADASLATMNGLPLVIRTHDQERVRITDWGSVGIGTPDPQATLDVRGFVTIDATELQFSRPALHARTGADLALLLESTKGGGGNRVKLDFHTYGTTGTAYHPTASIVAIDDGAASSSLAFETKQPGADGNPSIERLRITSTGNVGIGTANPEHTLDVKGKSIRLGLQDNGGGQLLLSCNENDNKIFLEAFNTAFDGSASELLVTGKDGANLPQISLHADTTFTNGSVGIGTRKPQAPLHVEGGAIINGNVGIGTGDPQAKLDVVGDARVHGYADPLWVIDQLDPQKNPALHFSVGGLSKAFIWWDTANNRLHLGTPTVNPIMALRDDGRIDVANDIWLTGCDCAEEFPVRDLAEAEPATVMVLDDDGVLRPCSQAYDRRVAGIISGAGDLQPAVRLGSRCGQADRLPLALAGRVYCKVDAGYGAIEVGDLLTTSLTAGHAMKADATQAFGAVLGKAIAPLAEGCGLVPVLVALQ